MMIFDKYFNFL